MMIFSTYLLIKKTCFALIKLFNRNCKSDCSQFCMSETRTKIRNFISILENNNTCLHYTLSTYNCVMVKKFLNWRFLYLPKWIRLRHKCEKWVIELRAKSFFYIPSRF